MLLLHYDACATVINGTAQTPKDVTQNPEIRSMLEGERLANSSASVWALRPARLVLHFSILASHSTF